MIAVEMFICAQTLAGDRAEGVSSMTEIVFVTSVKGIQDERVKSVSEGLKEKRHELAVSILEGSQNTELLTKSKLRFGPCIIIDGSLKFVGIPNLELLLSRVDSMTKTAAPGQVGQATAPTVQSSTAPTKSL